MFRARFCLLRRADRLKPADQARLRNLFGRYPRLAAGWAALQALHGAYQAEDKTAALEAIIDFCDLYEAGEILEFGHIVEAIINWGD